MIFQKNKTCLFVTERFLSDVLDKYGKHQASSDGGVTWYPPQACKFLKVDHLHSFVYKNEKSIIEKEQCSTKVEMKTLTTTFIAKRTSVN